MVAAQDMALGGIITAVGKKFFINYKNIFLQTFINEIEKSSFPPESDILELPLFNMHINTTISNFKLTDTTFDPSGTVFEIHSQEPQVNVDLRSINFEF
jgi:hypothetical protein